MTEPAFDPTWPPTLEQFRADAGVDALGLPGEPEDSETLQRVLDAAVAYVERVRPDVDYDGAGSTGYPPVTAEHHLGTLRMAARLWARRRTVDGVISAGDLGTARVPAYDADIERLLCIGRFRGPVIA